MKNREINIMNLIALIHIIDEYEEFKNKLIDFISVDYNRDLVYNLWRISDGKKLLGKRKIKKFYQENKKIIDIINKYSNISMFINCNYNIDGKPNNDNLEFFENYILQHKDKLDQILELLEKIKKLGFSTIEFNEDLDFTQNIYRLEDASILWRNVSGINYLNNIQLLPNYDKEYIEYKTTNSNYEIIVSTSSLSARENKIVLNSLLFDPNTLPETLDEETIFNEIINMRNSQQNDYDTLKKSVDLRLNIKDLCLILEDVIQITKKIDEVKNKEELEEILFNISDEISRLAIISHEYDKEIVKSNPSITHEILEKEKELCLKRKNESKYEI